MSFWQSKKTNFMSFKHFMTVPNYFLKFVINSWGEIPFPHQFSDLFNNRLKNLRINTFAAGLLFKCFNLLSVAVNAVKLGRTIKFKLRGLNGSYLKEHTVKIGITVEFQFYNNKIRMLDYCSKYNILLQLKYYFFQKTSLTKRVINHKIFNYLAPRQFRHFAVPKLFHLLSLRESELLQFMDLMLLRQFAVL